MNMNFEKGSEKRVSAEDECRHASAVQQLVEADERRIPEWRRLHREVH
jgi:hypothetical protein